ncbi:hypothetical protein BC332_12623 [Capsicum chinense]|nr:hypothetical protein BC332_12623 [Capsicum chinense]
MLEIEQPNQEEVHVFVKGQMLRFSINEFALITGLNCFENIDDFKYEDSSTRRLMKRYFPQSTNGVDKEALIELVKGNFENKEDALQMAILYFIHTFIYSQLNASSMLFSDLKMVEDGKYQFFLRIDQKFKDLESLMNARFNDVLNSLQQKNESMKQETIVKQSRQECDPSDAIVDDAGPTSTDSVGKEIDKSIEMEDDKVNQSPSFLKKGEQHEKQSDIVVEEIQPLESIIPGREHDLTLTIYKPPPTTPAEYTTTDYFFKVYIDKTYVNYYNSDVAKDLATQDASARTDEVADMEMSLINTIKGLSTCAGQPWHMVNEVFVPINCDDVFHWVLTVITLKNRCICVYDSMASS